MRGEYSLNKILSGERRWPDKPEERDVLCFLAQSLWARLVKELPRNRGKLTSSTMKLTVEDSFSSVHNYIDLDTMILRKGAVSAKSGERLIIPMNMRDGCLLCTGRGNPDWNLSAPHGAGRLVSRSEARESFTLSQYKKEMQGVYSTSVCRVTLDESPMAYKPMEAILEQIGSTVDVTERLRPIYNFKAGDE